MFDQPESLSAPGREKRPTKIGNLSASAKKAFRIITQSSPEDNTTLPNILNWKNDGLTDFYRGVTRYNGLENLLTIGNSRDCTLDGSDWKVQTGDSDNVTDISRFKVVQSENVHNNSIISIHSHSVPLQAHLADIMDYDKTSIAARNYASDFSNLQYNTKGVVGVTYPLGDDKSYLTDLYFMPSLEGMKAPKDFEFEGFSRGDVIPLINLLLQSSKSLLGNTLLGPISDKIEKYLLKKSAVGEKTNIQKVLNLIRRTEIQKLIKKFGIVHYQAETKAELMKKGVDSVQFRLL